MRKKQTKTHAYLSKDFLDNLRAAVSRAGGQEAVAFDSGVSQSHISRILNGGEAYVSTLVKIMAAAGGVGFFKVDPEAKALVVADAPDYIKRIYDRTEQVVDVREEMAQLRERVTQEMEQVAECKRQLYDQQRNILEAMVIVCREQGLTEAQSNAVQLAVFNYYAVLEDKHRTGLAGA